MHRCMPRTSGPRARQRVQCGHPGHVLEVVVERPLVALEASAVRRSVGAPGAG